MGRRYVQAVDYRSRTMIESRLWSGQSVFDRARIWEFCVLSPARLRLKDSMPKSKRSAFKNCHDDRRISSHQVDSIHATSLGAQAVRKAQAAPHWTPNPASESRISILRELLSSFRDPGTVDPEHYESFPPSRCTLQRTICDRVFLVPVQSVLTRATRAQSNWKTLFAN